MVLFPCAHARPFLNLRNVSHVPNLNIQKCFLQVDKLPKETLLNAAKTSMSSKIIGTESDYFAKIVSH